VFFYAEEKRSKMQETETTQKWRRFAAGRASFVVRLSKELFYGFY